MYHAGLVRGIERRGDLHRNLQGFADTHSLCQQGGAQRFAFNELRRYEMPVPVRTDLVNR